MRSHIKMLKRRSRGKRKGKIVKREFKDAYLDHDAAAADDLAGVALLVDLAQAHHLAQLLVVLHLRKREREKEREREGERERERERETERERQRKKEKKMSDENSVHKKKNECKGGRFNPKRLFCFSLLLCPLSLTLIRLMLCSAHRASTSLP